MKAVLVCFFICLLSNSTRAQENLIVWNEARPLQWIDFCGPVKDTSQYDAESYTEVRYHYKFITTKNFSFEVTANFNKQSSWFRKEMCCDDLLKHEQTHFNIAELFARKIKQLFENYHYSENYHEEIAKLFEEKKAEYHALQRRYDEQTNHSLNKKKQRKWESYVNRELSKMNDNYQNIDLAKSASTIEVVNSN